MQYVPPEETSDRRGMFVLSTGREIYGLSLAIMNGAAISLSENSGDLFDSNSYFSSDLPDNLTDAERAEIADYAIDLWRQWRHQK